MINILTDSTADLPKHLCKKYKIDVIPMYIQLNGEVYKDGTEITAEQLFDKVSQTGVYPTTSAPSPDDFIKFFNRDGHSIYIGVSSKLSSTFRNAQLALNELNNVSIDLIDSCSISTGYGQVVLQAAKWRDSGLAFDEIGRRIRKLIQKTRGIFILDTLDYLYHGGRCSSIENIVASVLKIHPFLNMQSDGTLGVLKMVRGSRKKAVNTLFSYFKDQMAHCTINEIFITHLDCKAEVDYLSDKISTLGYPIDISTVEVGCVLATHSGPKPLGIAYTVS